MNTANRELCQELYALSGWIPQESHWTTHVDNPEPHVRSEFGEWDDEEYMTVLCPAYDLGYLIKAMLPFTLMCRADITFDAYWISEEEIRARGSSESSPENAVVRLAIELFKQGVLKREAV